MAFEGFGKNSGPSAPPKAQIPFGNFPRPPSQSTSFVGAVQERSPRPITSPSWGNHPDLYVKNSNVQTFQGPSVVAPYDVANTAGTSIPAKPASFQILKRTRSPPLPSANEHILGKSSQNFTERLGSRTDLLFDEGPVARQRMHSPPLAFESNHSHLRHSVEEAQRPALSPPRWGNQPRSTANGNNSLTHQVPLVSPYIGSSDGGTRLPTKSGNFPGLKWTRSPPLPDPSEVFMEKSQLTQDDSKRSSISPSRPNSRTHQRSLPFAHDINAEGAGTKVSSFQLPKRTRSPPPPSSDQVFVGNSNSAQDDAEREIQAKAKRLARFNVELNQTVQSNHDLTNQKFSGKRLDQSLIDRKKIVEEHLAGAAIELPNGSTFSDLEGMESSHVIIGLCADMCPESEREERERKGDLDKFERLDGDRNQTSKSLAVKKYNRTAERTANLIRSMPVLQKTVDYLLSLLDQPYDDRFLGMYNFLWDRMRAIRMELRMQHIFNQGAITMLEQMIRLHIIAMHELCEYTKGEGFSEGFDAHLNIEQMNKTSVELFQMYDDHRKKGMTVPSEKEFRGYYALLKLDKHPGYKVEPAELSLDLAKMTTEIRQTPEVLFARDVARACRTGNFVAFFRLLRKATYLQACLMHAHFAKLRTQALASLQNGLQNNQGLPVSHVAKWLGMEEEDTESLLEYHGFSIKEFEESYMVKEGPFLNSDKDYPTKCSQLVNLKRSRRIIEDVAYSSKVVYPPAEVAGELAVDKIEMHNPAAERLVETGSLDDEVDEEMADFEADPEPKHSVQIQSILKTSSASDQRGGYDPQVVEGGSFSWGVPLVHHSPESRPTKVGRVSKPASDIFVTEYSKRKPHLDVKEMPIGPVSGVGSLVERSGDSQLDPSVENSVLQRTVIKDINHEDSMVFHQENENEKTMRFDHDEETLMAKLRLILRMWKRRSSKQKELREQRQSAANAALNLLSIGLPICQNKEKPSTIGKLEIDLLVKERHEKHRRSWSRLNTSEVIGGTLIERNSGAQCFCWKLLVCTQMNNTRGNKPVKGQTTHVAVPWLLSKLMAVGNEEDDERVISSPGLSVWKKWVTSKFDSQPICCLSVIRDMAVGNVNDVVGGASAILFLVSESISWELQKIQLRDLLMSVPSNSNLPLLILSGWCKEKYPDPYLMIVNGLGLNDIDRTKITSFSIVFLVGNPQIEHFDGFFSDDRLREGLQWLASQSPLQPVLHRLRTRELVLSNLNSSVVMLNNKNASEVGPNHCISVFNEALDCSIEEVANTANMNSACWPCPEIVLLEDSSDECRAVKLFLPSIGWSSAARIKPIISAMKGCRLPSFPDHLSWLNRGTVTGKEIHTQKSKLEKSLIGYLAESCKLMGQSLAAKEACVMIQKGAQLELHNSGYYIVPRWVVIFRRIFNWRLMNLTSGVFQEVYVSENNSSTSYREHCDVVSPLKFSAEFDISPPPTLNNLDNPRLDDDHSSQYSLTLPSLDEMVEVGCIPLLFGRDPSETEAFRPPSTTVDRNSGYPEASIAGDSMEDDVNLCQAGELADSDIAYLSRDSTNSSNGLVVVATKETKEADRLSKLLEQCNMLQNLIDEKLSIYF